MPGRTEAGSRSPLEPPKSPKIKVGGRGLLKAGCGTTLARRSSSTPAHPPKNYFHITGGFRVKF
eukprot:1491017-Amphidinium_carterae.1